MGTEQRKRALLIVATLCLAAFAGDRFVIEPLTATWKTRSARIAELEQSLSSGSLLVNRASTIRDRWQEMREGSLPTDTATAENMTLTGVGKWANASGVILTGLKPRWVDGETGRLLEVRLSATGNLPAVARFMYELESDPMALRLEDVEIRGRDDQGSDLTLDARFTGLVLDEAGHE